MPYYYIFILGLENEEEEQLTMSPEEWKKKKKKEQKEDAEVLKRVKPKENAGDYTFQRNLLLKPKTRDELKNIENEINHLRDLLVRYEQDEKVTATTTTSIN